MVNVPVWLNIRSTDRCCLGRYLKDRMGLASRPWIPWKKGWFSPSGQTIITDVFEQAHFQLFISSVWFRIITELPVL
jgi:hypothetical protein